MTAHKNKWNIAIVTTSRADLSIYASVIQALKQDGSFNPTLLVSGSHLSPEFGRTIDDIDQDALCPIRARIECLLSSDSEQGIAKAMGLAQISFAQEFEKDAPHLLLVLGDRFEMHAATCAAVPFRFPIAHLHGGEETQGAIDNAFRHSITKLSHVHFAATELAARRIMAMGENPQHVHTVGAPALDNIQTVKPLSRAEFNTQFDVPPGPFVLVTYHPETLGQETPRASFEKLWDALKDDGRSIIVTGSNADMAGRDLRARSIELQKQHSNFVYVEHFGALGYYSAMEHADLMVGNSSSGIIEAASFGLPVVNIGDRQKGREQSVNTIDVTSASDDIKAGIATASSPAHKQICESKANVYGDGNAAPRIATGLKDFLSQNGTVRKAFYNS